MDVRRGITPCVMVSCLAILASMVAHSPIYGQSDTQKRVALVQQADSLLENQQFEAALPLLNKLLEKSKSLTDADFDLLYKRAYCYYALSSFDEALADINRYIAKKPEDQAKLLRAYINQELDDYSAQLLDLNEFIEKNPASPELLRWRASVLMQSDQYAEAQQDLKTLMTLQPSPEIKAYWGLSYYYLEDADSALTIFDEVIAETPDFVQPYVYASSICLEEEAYELALQYLNKGLAIEPDNLTLIFYKGIALVENDKTDEGCRYLTKAFEGGIDDVADYLKAYCYGVD